MKLRVNLTVEEEVLKKAKYYAKEHNTSVSELVEEYLKNFTARTSKRKNLPETISSLNPQNNYKGRNLAKEYYEVKGKKHGR